jgi:hypothetical protein
MAAYGATTAAGAASAAAAIANAVKASGVLVKVEPGDFLSILGRMERPLVVAAGKGFLSPGYKYLTSYKGLAFYTKSREPLSLPGAAELVAAKTIWIPG